MNQRIKQLAVALVLVSLAPQALADSYRYMHVTIDTPWTIFLFLMVAVLFPFILMAILYWRTAFRRNAEEAAQQAQHDAEAQNKGGE